MDKRAIAMSPDALLDEPVEDRLVDTHEAARILGLKYHTVVQSRIYGGSGACPYIKLNRTVRYSLRELHRHLRRNVATSTSDYANA